MIDRAFPHTRISLATFDGWQVPSDPGGETDWPMERALLQQLRKAYGDKLVLQNNGLADQTCTASDGDQNLYCYLRSIRPRRGSSKVAARRSFVATRPRWSSMRWLWAVASSSTPTGEALAQAR